ncbi:hypothetical protein C8R45DRAFT_1027806 [Mycena sanguinolenta]|nr:hypothetical protein C8R45DRAFT_1027806 [Mycena sanguinolenta]
MPSRQTNPFVSYSLLASMRLAYLVLPFWLCCWLMCLDLSDNALFPDSVLVSDVTPLLSANVAPYTYDSAFVERSQTEYHQS